jgi:hypothetical protein
MKYETLTPTRKQFVDAALEVYPDLTDSINRKQIQFVISERGINWPQWLTAADNKLDRNLFAFPVKGDAPEAPAKVEETDEEISLRIAEKYESMETLIEAVSANTVNSLVIAGGAGLGKSYTVNKVLQEVNSGEYGYVFHRGYLKATHLFRLLWENRMAGQVIVLDDCDIWHDETSLNMLKAALELKTTRRIGWGSEKEFLDEDGEVIPRYFDYEGSIIFLTNLAIHDLIAAGGKNAPHLTAIDSRSLVLDLGIKTKREYMIKIKQTIESGMLKEKGLDEFEEQLILRFMEENINSLRELSLRMAEKIASLYLLDNVKWKTLAKTVCCKV